MGAEKQKADGSQWLPWECLDFLSNRKEDCSMKQPLRQAETQTENKTQWKLVWKLLIYIKQILNQKF